MTSLQQKEKEEKKSFFFLSIFHLLLSSFPIRIDSSHISSRIWYRPCLCVLLLHCSMPGHSRFGGYGLGGSQSTELMGFVGSMVPIAIAHLVLPPLSQLKKEESCPFALLDWWYGILEREYPDLVSSRFVYNQLTYTNEEAWERGEVHQYHLAPAPAPISASRHL